MAFSEFKHGREEDAVKTVNKALMYDRRFADTKFLASDNGPKRSGDVLQDSELLLAKVPNTDYQ